ncbi:aldose epimerase family protein [Niallia nealsonii]|uniref:Aldose 1-epimerase n=1 Tax=Niallia nealsonii TaxID=115979 RepID=A0A2N0Z2K1_9BACI|nr:aldose epimerase family protein [Niallia nealsonii]PKG23748.1 galactose-1-epimerase [Niallia nealsonii]
MQKVQITHTVFGQLGNKEVWEYVLENDNGMIIRALNYGAIVTSIEMKDAEGKAENISLGFRNLEDYLNYSPYFGAHVGRVAGRIADVQFEIDGETFYLDKNEGNNQLHGGKDNFSKKIWDVETSVGKSSASLIFRSISPDGENGYPGTLKATTTYTLTNNNEWVIDYYAETDKPTLYNPTNHVYFNLTGSVRNTILDHHLFINSNAYIPLQEDSLPIGGILPSAGTIFDLTTPTPIRRAVEDDDEQIQLTKGYDHPFLLSHTENMPDAILSDEKSGRTVYMYTDADSVVVYSGNKLKGNFDIDGYPVKKYSGVTLETQALPGASHFEDFGDIVLRPEKPFSSQTMYRFKVMKY